MSDVKTEFRKTHSVFTIYDSKAETYSQPFVQTTIGLGLRFLEQLAKDSQTAVSRYPEDHTLYQIGEWDDRRGEVKMIPHKMLCKASEYTQQDS